MKRTMFGIMALAMALGLGMPTASMGVTIITLTPEMDQNIIGESHTVTAKVTDGEGEPLVDVSVGFTVVVGDGGGGIDEIDAQVVQEEPIAHAVKIWLDDKFSGGGKIFEGTGKKKDWNKITFAGWAGFLCDVPIGQFEVTFHNVSEDSLDKCKFVSQDQYLGITELEWFDYYYEYDCPDAYPPDSAFNVVDMAIIGSLVYPDGTIDEDEFGLWLIAYDNGEPGNIDAPNAAPATDGIFFALYHLEEVVTCLYDSYLSGDFSADHDPCLSELVHELDAGNLQIVVPPEPEP